MFTYMCGKVKHVRAACRYHGLYSLLCEDLLLYEGLIQL